MINMRTLAIIIATTLACGSAMAQWQWIDAGGRKVFSDTAPPQGTPEKNILKRPGSRAASATVVEPVVGSNSNAASAPVAPKPAAVDPKLEAKKKEADKAEEAKRAEEAAKNEQARAENCNRAKSAKATLQSGTRLQTTNAKGEQAIMDDTTRAAEMRRVQGIIDSDCGAPPEAPAASRPKAPSPGAKTAQ